MYILFLISTKTAWWIRLCTFKQKLAHKLCTFKQKFSHTQCIFRQKFVHTLCTFKAYLWFMYTDISARNLKKLPKILKKTLFFYLDYWMHIVYMTPEDEHFIAINAWQVWEMHNFPSVLRLKLSLCTHIWMNFKSHLIHIYGNVKSHYSWIYNIGQPRIEAKKIPDGDGADVRRCDPLCRGAQWTWQIPRCPGQSSSTSGSELQKPCQLWKYIGIYFLPRKMIIFCAKQVKKYSNMCIFLSTGFYQCARIWSISSHKHTVILVIL